MLKSKTKVDSFFLLDCSHERLDRGAYFIKIGLVNQRHACFHVNKLLSQFTNYLSSLGIRFSDLNTDLLHFIIICTSYLGPFITPELDIDCRRKYAPSMSVEDCYIINHVTSNLGLVRINPSLMFVNSGFRTKGIPIL